MPTGRRPAAWGLGGTRLLLRLPFRSPFLQQQHQLLKRGGICTNIDLFHIAALAPLSLQVEADRPDMPLVNRPE